MIHQRILMACMVTFGLLMSAASHAQKTEPSDETDQSVVHSFVLPLDDGEVDFGKLLGLIVDELGWDGQSVRNRIDWKVSVTSTIGKFRLRLIQEITRDIVTFRTDPDRLVVRFDETRLRQEENEIRSGVRRLIERWFPGAAASAEESFGILVYLADDRVLTLEQAGDEKLVPDQVVVLVHGLDEPGKVWRSLIPALLETDYFVCEVNYPNDQPITDSTAFFAEQLVALHDLGVRDVACVAHSMGGLVSRDVLTNPRYYNGTGYGHPHYPDVQRLITVGTPNHGSAIARFRFATEIREQVERTLSGDGLFLGGLLDGSGEAKNDLLPGSAYLNTLNARPLPDGVEITIIAGIASPITSDEVHTTIGHIKPHVSSDTRESLDELSEALDGLVDGVGDGCVSFESTKLAGVTDFHTLEGNHLSMIRNYLASSDRNPPAIPIILERLGQWRESVH